MPLGHVDKLAKLVPSKSSQANLRLQKRSQLSKNYEKKSKKMRKSPNSLKFSGALEGLYSNASTHAAGIVISDRPLHEVTPLYRDPKSDMPANSIQHEMG